MLLAHNMTAHKKCFYNADDLTDVLKNSLMTQQSVAVPNDSAAALPSSLSQHLPDFRKGDPKMDPNTSQQSPAIGKPARSVVHLPLPLVVAAAGEAAQSAAAAATAVSDFLTLPAATAACHSKKEEGAVPSLAVLTEAPTQMTDGQPGTTPGTAVPDEQAAFAVWLQDTQLDVELEGQVLQLRRSAVEMRALAALLS